MAEGPAPRIAVCGPGVANPEELAAAEEVGGLLARAGAIVICGGRSGVMEAVARGAGEAGGTTLGFLPGTDPRDANPHISVPLPTGLAEARNFLIVRAAQALIAVGGEWGTLSEVAFAVKTGVPVVLLLPSRLMEHLGLAVAASAGEAVRIALEAAGP